ncbi:MAG: Na+/H+ antiporter NhaC family protein [Spirochaetia bacterium]
MKPQKEIKDLPTWLAFAPIVFVMALAIVGSLIYPLRIEWILLVGVVFVGFVAYWQGYRWADLEDAICRKMGEAWPGAMILMLVGAVVGTWMYSGTVPMLIYYGIKWLHPNFVPLTAFIVAAVIALFTGTSWGSAATAGVAFIGVASVLGVPLPLVAGAIISGAFLGDKSSPVSDTTVLSAIGAGSKLYAHVKTMLATTIPAGLVCVVGYAIMGFNSAGSFATSAESQQILDNLSRAYNFNILLLLPAVVIVGGAILQLSPILVIFTGSFLGLILGLIFQGFSLTNGVEAFIGGFNMSMIPSLQGVELNPTLMSLLNRGGIMSMMQTLLFLSCSMTFGALLQLTGALQKILVVLSKIVHNVFSLTWATWTATLIVNTSVSSAQFTFLTMGPIFRDLYKKYRLAPSCLSRNMEEGATLTEALIPWTVTAIYLSGILGVPTLAYAPFVLFNIASIGFLFIYTLLYPKIKMGMPEISADDEDPLFVTIRQAVGDGNFATVDACATRLRLTVKDSSLLNQEAFDVLLKMGHRSLIDGNSVQIILGPEAEIVAKHFVK